MAFHSYRLNSFVLTLALGLQAACGGKETPADLSPDDAQATPSTTDDGATSSGSPSDDNASDEGGAALGGGDGPGTEADAAPPADSDAGPGTADDVEDRGVGDGHDVVLIGDSWMNLGSGVGIQQSVEKAVDNKPYRLYGVPGTRMLDGVIPGQYETAKKDNADIKTVIMTGGGNDVLLDPLVLADCVTLGARCKGQIDKVGEAYTKLASEAAADGVLDLVIVLYTRGTLMGSKVIDYIWDKMTPICDDAPVRCHLLDPDKLGSGVLTTRDGIHPVDSGYDLIGKGVVDLMNAKGMRR